MTPTRLARPASAQRTPPLLRPRGVGGILAGPTGPGPALVLLGVPVAELRTGVGAERPPRTSA